MPAELPQELADRAERYLRQFDRGICTLDELENELLGAAHNYADGEYERANPGWAKEAIFDQAAWETVFEAKRQAQAEAGAVYALALAETYEPARGLVEWVFRSPQWRQALEPVARRLTEAGIAGSEAVAAEAETAWFASWRGVLPAEAREAIRGATLASAASMVDLLEADREGDIARAGQIVVAAGQRGCVSPAVHLLRLRVAEGRPVAASQIASLLDPGELAGSGEFGGITRMAVELLADGADAAALAWSSAIDDAALFHAPDERPTIYAGREPYFEYHDDRQRRDHGPSRCVALCNCGDARLLGALALVDWIAGNKERAKVRAASCDRGSDPNGWSAAGVELLAEWVLSRRLEPIDRVQALTGMLERAGRSHVDLGLLGIQIHAELVELAEVVGNRDAIAHHQARAEWFRGRPMMDLHFEPFQFQSLLSRLPLVNT